MSLFQLSRPRIQRMEQGEDSVQYATPRSNVYEVNDAFVVELDVPGVDQDTIDIQVEKNILSFNATRTMQAEEGYKRIYGEFASVHYRRRFDIGELIDTDHIDARYRNGVVTLRLPKRAEVSARRIQVKAG